MKTVLTSQLHTTMRRVVTLPRLLVFLVVLCLVLQIQKSKSVELPKYSLPEYVKQSVVERVNHHRSSLQVEELTLDDSLSTEAGKYCEMIAKGNLQANLAAVNLSSALNARDVEAWDGAKGVVRNIAVFESKSGSPALDAVRRWLANNEEANNLERADLAKTGVGVVKQGDTYYICQIFAPQTQKK
jgi:uncharacterized protein YkwD